MSSFTTDLVGKDLDDGLCRELTQSFTYDVGELGGDDSIVVPAGFVTDYASVPRILWNILPPWGRYSKAAVLHDYLYKTQSRARVVCDAIFLEAMEVLGVSFVTRMTMYLGVRSGGWVAWRKHKRDNRVKCEKVSDAIAPVPKPDN